MDIAEKKIIPDLRVFEVVRVSREHGRRVRHALEKKGQISPDHTPTGRCLLSIGDAQKLAEAL